MAVKREKVPSTAVRSGLDMARGYGAVRTGGQQLRAGRVRQGTMERCHMHLVARSRLSV